MKRSGRRRSGIKVAVVFYRWMASRFLRWEVAFTQLLLTTSREVAFTLTATNRLAGWPVRFCVTLSLGRLDVSETSLR
jgi:hypothetical protein